MATLRCEHRATSVLEDDTALEAMQQLRRQPWVAVCASRALDEHTRSVAMAGHYWCLWVTGSPYSAGVIMRNSEIVKVVFGDETIPGVSVLNIADLIAAIYGCAPPKTLERAEQIVVPHYPWSASSEDDRCPQCRAILISRIYEHILNRDESP